jgi:hypothetical protein
LQIKKYNASFLPFFMFFATLGEDEIPSPPCRDRISGFRDRLYLAAGGLQGFGGACRSATGTEWARAMVCLMAMQGLGKPGVNMGCMQQGTPVDTSIAIH